MNGMNSSTSLKKQAYLQFGKKKKRSSGISQQWSNQYKTLNNQSKFHELIRQLILEDPYLSGLRCYQEVPVKDLINDYKDNHYYDWYIKDLDLIIELHGKQHYELTNFGNAQYEDAKQSWLRSLGRDIKKEQAALAQNLKYLVIPYSMESKLTSKILKDLIFEAITN